MSYIDFETMTSGDIRKLRLCLETSLLAPDDADAALDAVNELVRLVDGPRDLAVVWSRATRLALTSAHADADLADRVLHLLTMSLRAAEDVQTEVEFDDLIDNLSDGEGRLLMEDE